MDNETKLAIVHELNTGQTVRELSDKHGIPKQSIYNWHKIWVRLGDQGILDLRIGRPIEVGKTNKKETK